MGRKPKRRPKSLKRYADLKLSKRAIMRLTNSSYRVVSRWCNEIKSKEDLKND